MRINSRYRDGHAFPSVAVISVFLSRPSSPTHRPFGAEPFCRANPPLRCGFLEQSGDGDGTIRTVVDRATRGHARTSRYPASVLARGPSITALRAASPFLLVTGIATNLMRVVALLDHIDLLRMERRWTTNAEWETRRLDTHAFLLGELLRS